MSVGGSRWGSQTHYKAVLLQSSYWEAPCTETAQLGREYSKIGLHKRTRERVLEGRSAEGRSAEGWEKVKTGNF